jgi:hypothetical protein
MAFNFLLVICLYFHSFELFNCGTRHTMGHFLADAGEREVNLLETWDIKPFA